MKFNSNTIINSTSRLSKHITLLCYFALILVTVLGLSSCSKKDTAANILQGSIEIAGSSTVFPITAAVAEEFVKEYPEVNIPIRSTGTGGGFKNFFVSGKTDINNASRPIKDSELASAEANGIEAIELQIAIDAISIVVNNDNTVDNITTEELNAIWHPDTAAAMWNEVNPAWHSAIFELYGPSSASGTFDYFTEVINGDEGLSRADYQKTEQDNTIIQAVAGSVNALGYLGLAYYLENKSNIKALKVNGIAPSLETARSNEYNPLSRPVFIYVSSKALAKKEVVAFIRYYLEVTDTSLISDVGYVPVTAAIKEANLKRLDEALEMYAAE